MNYEVHLPGGYFSGELLRTPVPGTGVKIALATDPFSWLRGSPARAMDHFGE
jgi:hypothetical protein